MALPKNSKSFYISVEGETSFERYEGDFTCICVPSITIKNKIDRDELRETGDLNNIGAALFLRSKWLVNVQNRLMSWPDWWDGCRHGALLLDDNVLKEIYDKCIDAEIEWRQNVKKKSTEPTPSQE